MLACVQRARGGSTEPYHIIADSAFAAKRSMEEFGSLGNSVVSISINNTPTSGFSSLYSFISQDLPANQSRTYTSNSTILQIVGRGPRSSAIANAFKLNLPNHAPPSTPNPFPSPILSYATALAMLKNDSAAAIKQAFNLPDTIPLDDIVAVILAATGMLKKSKIRKLRKS